ncbi:MAG TPA: tol-pal system protein YbgF [Woeseiaceae bacterium]|nr:tol-pal system protein YbgF [Woeseiaceae bacterium]
MKRTPAILTLGLLSLLAAGCATAPEEDPVLIKLDELDRRLTSIERVIQNQSLVELTQDVSSLQRRTDEILGLAQTLDYNATSTAERQRELYNDLDARLQALEAGLTAGAAAGGEAGAAASGQLPVPGGSEDVNYRAAFELVKEQRYDEAETAFREFLDTFPESSNASNAQYWLAETYYVRQQYERALESFQTVVQAYPESRKVVDALLKIGYCNYELERWDAAKQALVRVQSEYPDTTAARLAGQRLERMETEGV